MDKFEEYESLLNEDDITAVRERREAIGRAMDTLMAQMEEFHAERKKLDEKDQHVYVLARKLDEAHARISRGVRYTAQSKKRLVRRVWNDDTHQWVEDCLLQWVRKVLQEGPKSVGTMQWEKGGRFAVSDAVALMEQHPEEFEYNKGPKPPRKYARVDYVWSLKNGSARQATTASRPLWNVEATFVSHGQERQRTLSESMHDMLEEAIQSFYAKQSSSIFAAFADLYYREFARVYQSMKGAYDYARIATEMMQKREAQQTVNAHSEAPKAAG